MSKMYTNVSILIEASEFALKPRIGLRNMIKISCSLSTNIKNTTPYTQNEYV